LAVAANTRPKPDRRIATMGEKSLHAALKKWYSKRGDRLEQHVDGFLIDVRRGKLLIEIQTRNFYSIRRKLRTLVADHPVRLVHPLSADKWIVRVKKDGCTTIGRRKSPKHEGVFHLFEELVSFPDLIEDQNFSLEVLFVQEEEIRCDDGKGSRWRQGWSIRDRKLVGVKESRVFNEVADFQALLPPTLPDPFSTRDLSRAVNTPRWLAQKMAFCLRRMGAVEQVGKERNALLYTLPFAKGPLANRR